MKQPEAQLRAGYILKELGKYPAGLLTVDEVLFLASRCRRVADSPILVVGAFDESDLRELEKILSRVNKVSRTRFKLLSFEHRKKS